MPPGQIFSLVVLVLFIFGAFYFRSFILKRASGQTKGILGNRNISVLENFAIARDRSFCLVKTAGKVYLVAFSAGAVTVIDTFDADEFSKAATENQTGDSGGKTAGAGMSSNMMTSNSPYARMTRALARFIAKKMGRKFPYEDRPAENFADTFKASNDKAKSNRPSTSNEPEDRE